MPRMKTDAGQAALKQSYVNLFDTLYQDCGGYGKDFSDDDKAEVIDLIGAGIAGAIVDAMTFDLAEYCATQDCETCVIKQSSGDHPCRN